MQVTVAITPKPVTPLPFAAPVNISDPQPFPMPTGWQIDKCTPGSGGTATLSLLNGTGAPRTGDQFTVGSKPDVYVVKAYRPATSKNPVDQIDFVSLTGAAIDPTAFCHCCAPNFVRPAPQNWSIKSGPKIGDTTFTIGSSNATSGVIDIGDTFLVDHDDTIYSVRYFDPSTATIYFLPEAATEFTSSTGITFQPPLEIEAANPGAWGNLLTASVDYNGITDTTAKQFAEYDLVADDLFNITITQKNARGKVVTTERFLNVAVKSTGNSARFPNRLDRVLANQSNLARVA